MMLCGLSEGSTTVTAQHASLPSLSSSVTVNVEMLKNKLYLFQFTPAVQTTVSYEDGKGNTHTVVSNSDGSLALYEPNGIASDLRCASAVGDEIYRGTASMLGDTFNVNLKSGEGNGVYDELYPLNAVKLQPAASMELTIFRPDGEPLKNAKVTLRGGVYRNLDQVTDAFQRDTAYCPNAKFSTTNDDTADLNGREDQVFTTDGNGVLRVYMDSTQFKRNASDSEPDQSDLIRFVFELRFANDEYQPELVEFDTRMTQSDVIRSGGNLLTLTAASGAKPVIATQTVDYYTGREINVGGDSGISLMSLDNPNKLNAIETNSYPFTMPMISDDGSILVYLSDADSTNVEDVEVRYSRAYGGYFPDGTAIDSPADFDGYGDSNLDLDGNDDHAAAIWLRQSAHLDLSPDTIVSQEDQLALTRGLEVVASIWDGSDWATTRLTENATQELTPVIAISADGSRAVAGRQPADLH